MRQYQSRHDASWVDLQGALTGEALRKLCDSPKAQHSLRSLNWEALLAALDDHPKIGEVRQWVSERESSPAGGGHQTRMTRVRLGQGAFRASTLGKYGPVCAISGPAPAEVLDAAHLYSYAEIGTHYEHGGFMLRKDLHLLFDRGSIAIDPDKLIVDVTESLRGFPSYAALHESSLEVKQVNAMQRKWLAAHWRQHRGNV